MFHQTFLTFDHNILNDTFSMKNHQKPFKLTIRFPSSKETNSLLHYSYLSRAGQPPMLGHSKLCNCSFVITKPDYGNKLVIHIAHAFHLGRRNNATLCEIADKQIIRKRYSKMSHR